MITLLIVAILASLAVPLMRGRVDVAKWSEGKVIACSIATAIRQWSAETNKLGSWTENNLPPTKLGFGSSGLSGTYFKDNNFKWDVAYDGADLTYIITITPPEEIGSGPLTLDNSGNWSN